jgi:hypothetical protein
MGALDAAHQACAVASASGLRSALMASVCVFFVAAAMFLLAARTCARTISWRSRRHERGSACLVRGYIAAFNRNDFDGFGAYYAPDVVLPARLPRWWGARRCLISIAL